MVPEPIIWRRATATDDESIIAMCLDLNRVDPGQRPVSQSQVLRTRETLRNEPWRGLAVVAQIDNHLVGYALLIGF